MWPAPQLIPLAWVDYITSCLYGEYVKNVDLLPLLKDSSRLRLNITGITSYMNNNLLCYQTAQRIHNASHQVIITGGKAIIRLSLSNRPQSIIKKKLYILPNGLTIYN